MGKPYKKQRNKDIKRIIKLRKNPITKEQRLKKELEYKEYMLKKDIEYKQFLSLSEDNKKLYSTIEKEAILWSTNAQTAGSLARNILTKLEKWN